LLGLLFVDTEYIFAFGLSKYSLVHSKSLVEKLSLLHIEANELVILENVVVKIRGGDLCKAIFRQWRKNIPKMLETATFGNQHEVVEVSRCGILQVLFQLRHN
jgi:hypothetical protein